jgi:type I restriction enzyme S subunit
MSKHVHAEQGNTNHQWLDVSLGDLGVLYCGQSPASKDVNTEGRGEIYVTGPEQWDGQKIVSEKWTTDPKRIAPDGSIFITVKGCVGEMFRGERCAIGRDIYAFKPSKELNFDFVFWAIQEGIQKVIAHAKGDIPGISKYHILDHRILLPGRKAQDRAVAKLDELFSELEKGIESLKAAREQLKAYRQAVLKHAFEGRLTEQWREENNAPPWVNTTLGKQLSFLTSGSRGWAKFYAESGEIFIRAQNLKHDALVLDDVAFVNLPDKAEGMRTRVQKGDLLITITGANVTKTGYVTADIGSAYVSQHVALARPVEDVDTEYLYWYLVAEAGGRKQLNDMAYGAGKPGLNLDNIRSVQFPMPSFDEQREVVTCIESLLSLEEKLLSDIDQQIEGTPILRHAILKKAFSGQLVEQDPADEPASALLDRIKAEKSSAGGKSRKKKKEEEAA